MSKPTNSTITWFQVNNWIPLIGSVVMIALAFGALNTRLSLIEQKLQSVSDQQLAMIELFKSVETRYGELALQVERLETIQSIE